MKCTLVWVPKICSFFGNGKFGGSLQNIICKSPSNDISFERSSKKKDDEWLNLEIVLLYYNVNVFILPLFVIYPIFCKFNLVFS